eukprot:RCo018189
MYRGLGPVSATCCTAHCLRDRAVCPTSTIQRAASSDYDAIRDELPLTAFALASQFKCWERFLSPPPLSHLLPLFFHLRLFSFLFFPKTTCNLIYLCCDMGGP